MDIPILHRSIAEKKWRAAETNIISDRTVQFVEKRDNGVYNWIFITLRNQGKYIHCTLCNDVLLKVDILCERCYSSACLCK
jgi:hypothetical protein